MEEVQNISMSNYVVVFLDIMGQSDKLKTIKKLPETKDEYETTLQTLRETAGTIIGIQESINRTIVSLNANTTFDKPPSMSSRDWQSWKKKLRVMINNQVFSDSLIIFTTLDGDDKRIQEKSVYLMLSAVVHEMMTAFLKGIPLRGAIEFGVGLTYDFSDKKHFYGPVLHDVYRMESEIADYPRIIIGSRFHEILKQWSQSHIENKMDQIKMAIMKQTLDLIHIDYDGMAVLDYAGPAFRNLLNETIKENVSLSEEKVQYDELFGNALERAKHEALRFKEKGNYKLYTRYSRMYSYLKDARTR